MNAESAPKGAPQIVAPQRDHPKVTSEIGHSTICEVCEYRGHMDGGGRDGRAHSLPKVS